MGDFPPLGMIKKTEVSQPPFSLSFGIQFKKRQNNCPLVKVNEGKWQANTDVKNLNTAKI